MKIKIIIGLFFSFGLILFILSGIDYQQITDALKSAKFTFIIAGLLMTFFALLIRSLRWKYLLQPLGSVSLYHLYSVTSIGAMTDMIMPARPGDLVRAYLIGKRAKVNKVSSLATIVIERLLDIMSILLILMFVLVFTTFQGNSIDFFNYVKYGAFIFVFIAILIFLLLYVMKYHLDKLSILIKTCFGFLPGMQKWMIQIDSHLKSFKKGLSILRKGRYTYIIVCLSIFLWISYAFTNLIVLHSFNLQLPIIAAFYFLIFQIIGVSIPSSPGFIGTYHASVIAGFTIFMVSRELALSVAIIMHGIFFFPFIFLGLFFLGKEGLSFKKLWNFEKGNYE